MFQVGLLRGLKIYIDSHIWLPFADNFLDLWVWEVQYMGAIQNDNNGWLLAQRAPINGARTCFA